MNEHKHFCTCHTESCPHHPSRHEMGCDPCIKKNMTEGEIPACFWNPISDNFDGVTEYTTEGFVRFYLKHKGNPLQKSYPFLLFTNCNAEEALTLYLSLFNDASLDGLRRWLEDSPAAPAGKVQNAFFTLKGVTYRIMDSHGHAHSLTPSTSIFVVCDDEDELRKAYNGLMDDGFELMPLGEYPFSRLYAWVQDKYGLTWQLSLE